MVARRNSPRVPVPPVLVSARPNVSCVSISDVFKADGSEAWWKRRRRVGGQWEEAGPKRREQIRGDADEVREELGGGVIRRRLTLLRCLF